MKNYIEEKNYVVEDAIKELLKDINNDLSGAEVDSEKYGKGKLLRFINLTSNACANDLLLSAEIEFKEKTAAFGISLGIKSGLLKFNSEFLNKLEEYNSAIAMITAENKKQNTERFKEKEKEYQDAQKEKAAEDKRKKDEIKAEQRQYSNMRNAQLLTECYTHVVNNNYYYSLGYIAKHVKNITAAMPDYLDNWFVKEFGDVKRRVVDQSKLSPSGLPAQFALYLKIDLDTNENIPYYLEQYLGDVKKDIKPISDTRFVYGIMKNEGFKFGKSQDIDAILDKIPSEFLDDFKKGYSL